jgi:hydrogenase maturation protease
MNLTVIGIGQSLRGDDGAGPETVRRWSAEFARAPHSAALRVELLETPGLELLDHFDDCNAAILVDAVSTGKPAGTVSVFSPIPETGMTAAEKTAHGFGAAETISIARKTGARLPEQLILIGIEGEQYQLGRGLSDSVQAAIPNAVAILQKEVDKIRAAD